MRSERSEGAPLGGSEAHRDAGRGVVEGLDDVAGEALKPVDVAPGRLPGSKVRGQLVGGGRERYQQFFGGQFGDMRPTESLACRRWPRGAGHLSPQKMASEVGTELTCPAQIPRTQQCDLFGQFRFQWIVCSGLVPGLERGRDRLLEPR